jgi:ankyrin repeat protein
MADIDAKDNDERMALHRVAKNRHLAVLQLLLKHMVDVDAKDNDGRTALTERLRMGTRQRYGCCQGT